MSDVILVAMVAGLSNVATAVFAFLASTYRHKGELVELRAQLSTCREREAHLTKSEQRTYEELQVVKAHFQQTQLVLLDRAYRKTAEMPPAA